MPTGIADPLKTEAFGALIEAVKDGLDPWAQVHKAANDIAHMSTPDRIPGTLVVSRISNVVFVERGQVKSLLNIGFRPIFLPAILHQ